MEKFNKKSTPRLKLEKTTRKRHVPNHGKPSHHIRVKYSCRQHRRLLRKPALYYINGETPWTAGRKM